MGPAEEPSTHPSDIEKMRDPANRAGSEAFFRRYRALLEMLCRRECRIPGQEEELSQDVIVKLLSKLRRFRYDPSLRFRGWLRTLVRNEALDQWRRWKSRPGDNGGGGTANRGSLAEVQDSRGASVEAVYIDLETELERERLLAIACQRVRDRVSESRWRAFWLTSVEGRRGLEVAAELGMSVGSVYAATHYVLKLIRAEVDRSGRHEGAC
jgi:RNA polymerase sigma-70 factor (ECF subfamily)